ncbi:WD40-repeat-containing domain [Pseudocohnilembus persalinus]|uniref:WD40-repeat-containing domain n=1 Tax=Pseudocohnilembus persalinus TaxID=266149 RepID=A0A0V0QJ65_PSEPJ|nr:WD40-repeat-containing domain [Pseudocohnilembus persalinus]|eukprot:KRX02188.1 WD40-repeat-containing domain [Pseudocohnilembus persalinus]
MRNFREHLNIKVIPIKFTPMYIQCCHKNDCIIVSDKDGGISIYDYQTGLELDREIISKGQSIQSIQFIDNRELYPGNELIQENRNDPNQPFPPYLIATSQNQISLVRYLLNTK